VTIITVPFFAHWTMDMQFNKDAVVLLHGRERCRMLSFTSFRGRTRFPRFLNPSP